MKTKFKQKRNTINTISEFYGERIKNSLKKVIQIIEKMKRWEIMMEKLSGMKNSNNIYFLPVNERKNNFFELLSRTNCDTETSRRREKILVEIRMGWK